LQTQHLSFHRQLQSLSGPRSDPLR
jgi:hypothetical protein